MPADPIAPEVSILVPCWNAAASIERALGSVLAERDLALECVVVDDGSTDATVEVVRAVATGDSRVVLLTSPVNEGVSAARNRGLRALRGTWLTFLDADDRLLPGGLAAMYRAAIETDALAVVGQRVWSDGERTWINGLYDRPDIRRPGRKSLRRNPGLVYYASATGKLIHRSCREDLWFTGRVLGDQPWTLRALLRAGDRIEVIADDVYEYARPPASSGRRTITVAKHGSARVGAEAVRVAVGGLREVADEAERTLVDPPDRDVVVGAYVNRLARVDLAGAVVRAAASGSADAAEVFDEVGAFLGTAPPALVGRSTAVLVGLVLPPLALWRRLEPTARTAAWSMISTATDIGRPARGVSPLQRAAWRTLSGIGATRERRPRPVVDASLGLASLVLGPVLTALARRRQTR